LGDVHSCRGLKLESVNVLPNLASKYMHAPERMQIGRTNSDSYGKTYMQGVVKDEERDDDARRESAKLT
jgi:hypothetical protein